MLPESGAIEESSSSGTEGEKSSDEKFDEVPIFFDASSEEDEVVLPPKHQMLTKDNNYDNDDDEDYDFGDDANVIVTAAAKRFSRRVSSGLRRSSSIAVETLPETYSGWTILLSALAAAFTAYEVNLQHKLTAPPSVYGQFHENDPMTKIYKKLTQNADAIFSRNIQPSLFVGTRSNMASFVAYILKGPEEKKEHLRFREIIKMPMDGAQIGLDWEIPKRLEGYLPNILDDEQKNIIQKGPIYQPVVLVLHGLNNHASFGYIRSMMRTLADRGWIAAGMNFRGCGGVHMTTPRGYTSAYTGDLRSLVQTISSRMGDHAPLFLVGYSLGANVLTKYMGEESYSGTLPDCVKGAVSLGNPLSIDSRQLDFPFAEILALGVKKYIIENWTSFRQMQTILNRSILRRAMMQIKMCDFDHVVSPVLIRNDPFYPHSVRIGYTSNNGGEEYWNDASSYRYIRYISVPFLCLMAQDDAICQRAARSKLSFCLANPNVMVVETTCGGHLGWQASPPESEGILNYGSHQWADTAVADFIQANIEFESESGSTRSDPCISSEFKDVKVEAAHVLSKVKSRL